ncbi:MAG TPA: hypothetical protein VFP78_08430 [Solirubrobacteraceae bacterium]|nr:hypothetical protein [Solirubrobacteraceae bacterium]
MASIAASGASITTELADDEPASPSSGRVEQAVTGPSCVQTLDQVMDFVTEHPRAGRVYAREGDWQVPRLAAKDVIDACGDPETLVEEAGVVEK